MRRCIEYCRLKNRTTNSRIEAVNSRPTNRHLRLRRREESEEVIRRGQCQQTNNQKRPSWVGNWFFGERRLTPFRGTCGGDANVALGRLPPSEVEKWSHSFFDQVETMYTKRLAHLGNSMATQAGRTFVVGRGN